MTQRQTAQSNGFGAVLQVLVVGVLLFAVVWQVQGVPSRDESPVDPPVAVEEPTRTPYLTTDEVNLRRGPGLDHDVLSVAPMRAKVIVTGESVNGFVPVDAGETTAWVSESYLASEGAVLSGTTGNLAEVESPPAEINDEPVEVVAEPTSEPRVVPTEAPVEEPPPALAAQVYEAPVEEPVVEEPGERWIEVDRSTATITLHEGSHIVAQFTGLLGKDPSPDGYYSTAVGTYHVHTMTEELAETPFAPGVYLTHFVGFDPERSNGFHSPTRNADGNVVQTGGTTTLGCVRLSEGDAIQLFDFAHIGMRVEIHD